MLTLSRQILLNSQQRHAQFYLDSLQIISAEYQHNSAEALVWLDRDLSQIKQAQTWAAEQFDTSPDAAALCSAYAEAGADLLDLRLEISEQLKWVQTALSAARQLGDRRAEGLHLRQQTHLYIQTGDYIAATTAADQALVLAWALIDQNAIAASLNLLGMAATFTGNADRALTLHQESLTVAQQGGNIPEQIKALQGLWQVAFTTGSLPKAVEYVTDALKLEPKPSQQATLLFQLGDTQYSMGDLATARESLNQSLTINQQLNYQRGIAECLRSLGYVYAEEGNFVEAQTAAEHSLAIFSRLQDRRETAIIYNNLGTIAIGRGNNPDAQHYYRLCLKICEETGDATGIATALSSLAYAYQLAQQIEQAREYYAQAVSAYQSAGDVWGTAMCNVYLGDIAVKLEDYTNADSLYRTALAVFEPIDEIRGVARALLGLGKVAVGQQNYAEAKSLFDRALRIALDTEVPPLAALILKHAAGLKHQQGDVEGALGLLGFILHQDYLPDILRQETEALLAEIRTQLSPEQVESALTHGQTLTLKTIVI